MPTKWFHHSEDKKSTNRRNWVRFAPPQFRQLFIWNSIYIWWREQALFSKRFGINSASTWASYPHKVFHAKCYFKSSKGTSPEFWVWLCLLRVCVYWGSKMFCGANIKGSLLPPFVFLWEIFNARNRKTSQRQTLANKKLQGKRYKCGHN